MPHPCQYNEFVSPEFREFRPAHIDTLTQPRPGCILVLTVWPLRHLRVTGPAEHLKFVMAAEDHMDISLTPELEAYVNEMVRSGRFLSAGEVVREALRLLEERDRRKELDLAELREKVAAGLEQLDRGEAWDLPDDIEEAVQEIESQGRRRLGQGIDPCP